jgi:hypothetical protein
MSEPEPPSRVESESPSEVVAGAVERLERLGRVRSVNVGAVRQVEHQGPTAATGI